MIEGARIGRRIARAAPFAALVEQELLPPPEATSDEDLLDFVRATATHGLPSLRDVPDGERRCGGAGPAASGEGDRGASRADASAMPLVPSSNIQPAVMMIAERAAGFMRAPERAG